MTVLDLPATGTDQSLVIRTDFSDDRAWSDLRAAMREPAPVGADRAAVEVAVIDDPAYAGLLPDDLIAPGFVRNDHTYVFLVDSVTITDPEHPVLVVDLWEDPGRTFRVVPAQFSSVETTLSDSHIDFSDVADNASPDGVFRGFADDL
jgi:uncharacterized protein DUF6924